MENGEPPLMRISVFRLLLGDPGMTYDYFNIKLFAFPWSPIEHDDTVGADARYMIGYLNQVLQQKSVELVEHPEECNYNVTLMNYYDPNLIKSNTWREDPLFGLGKLAVVWHVGKNTSDFLFPLQTKRIVLSIRSTM